MTRYTVVWVESAQNELAQEWLDAQDRSAVSAAANAIDHELRDDAARKGIELKEGMRALFSPPLRILFIVREADRLVEVLRVRHI